MPRGPGPGPSCRFSSFSWGGGEAGRGWGPMSCAAPGPALALDATVSYCCWVHIKSRIKLQAWVLFCGAFTALVEYGLLKFISKIMTENSVFSRLFYSC